MADEDDTDTGDRPDESERAAIRERVATAEKELQQPKDAGTPVKHKALKSSKSVFEHGHFTVKVHQVVEADLDDLGRMNRDAALLTAAAAGFGGFAVDVTKDLLLSGGAPIDVRAFFAGVSAASGFMAIICAVAAWRKWIERGDKLRHIKKQTKFLSDN